MLLLVNLFISVTDVSARFLVIPTQYRELSKHTTWTAWFYEKIIWFLFYRYPLLNQQQYMQLIGVADTCANFLVIQKHSKQIERQHNTNQIYNHSTEDSRNKAAAREDQKVSNASPSHQNQVHLSVYST